MGYKENVGRYSPKGIMLNLTHLVVFFTPIILCTRGFEEWAWLWKVNLGVFCAMFATPPPRPPARVLRRNAARLPGNVPWATRRTSGATRPRASRSTSSRYASS